MRKLILVLMVSVLLSAVPVPGGPLARNQVSAGANWVVHTDLEQFKNTRIWQLIREDLKNQGLEEKLENFSTVFSFHPLDDVRNVTIYGKGRDPKQAVVLIEGNFDKERLLSLVRMNASYYEIEYGEFVVHSWIDEKKRDPNDRNAGMMYGCFHNDELIVMGAGLEAVKLAIDVLDGSAENAASDVFSQAILDTKGAFFQVAANGVGEVVGEEPQAAALKQADKLGAVIGESEGKFYVVLSLTAKTEEVAHNVSKFLEGVLAFAMLLDKEQPGLAEMAKMTKLSCVDKTVHVHFESDPESVVQFLKDKWQRKIEKDNQTE